MIHFKNINEKSFEFWFTKGISESDMYNLTRKYVEYTTVRSVDSTEKEFKLSTRLHKNHYIFYSDGVIGTDQLDNIDD